MNGSHIGCVALLLLLASGNASAYVDGGTGLMMIQGLVALIGAIVFFVKNPARSIKAWFSKRSDKDEG